MDRSIDYGNLMHSAMRGLIRTVLTDIAASGLPGQHHFFITFDTMHPDVEIADWLSDRYPDEMTVVMQHWFENLDVGDDGFAVTLNFGDSPEPLYIPYDAIRTFVDPSVEFGLRFETQEELDEEKSAPTVTSVTESNDGSKEKPENKADIVSLDSFRK
ncbi:MAG: SspB family protein [Boseongicola sp.]